MASNLIPAKQVLQQVRPLLSVDKPEARRRVLHLYKAWVRGIPEMGKIFSKILADQKICSKNMHLYISIM